MPRRGGHATRARRSQLLPALHAVQSRIGWISQPALNYISRRLAVAPAEAYGVATFYALFATTPRPPVVVHVCDDIACRLAGAERICDDLARGVAPAGEPVDDGRAAWIRSPCLGLCDRAPAAMVTRAGEASSTSVIAPVDAVGVIGALEPGGPAAADRAAPPRGSAGRPRLLRRVGRVDPMSLDDYRADDGYAALARAHRDRSRGRHRRGHRLEADGSRRGGVPDRPQVGRRRIPAGAAALPRLQRGRIRAGHVQGPGPARGRPVRHRRGDDHRRLRDRGEPGLPLHPGRISRRRGPRRERDRARPRGRPARAGHPRLGLRLRHRAATWRWCLHLRRGDGAVRIDRGQARRAAQQAAVPGRGRAVRQADRGQQRRDPGQRAAHRPRRRRGLRPDRDRGIDRAEAVLPVRPRRPAGGLRGRVRRHAGRPHRAGRWGAGRSRHPDDPARRGGRRLRRVPRRSTCRSPSRRRAPPGRRSARA